MHKMKLLKKAKIQIKDEHDEYRFVLGPLNTINNTILTT